MKWETQVEQETVSSEQGSQGDGRRAALHISSCLDGSGRTGSGACVKAGKCAFAPADWPACFEQSQLQHPGSRRAGWM